MSLQSRRSHLNPDVLKAWCDAPSHFLTLETAAAPAEHTQSAESSPRRHRYTPAEISQYSVDLLLREYYAIVTSQRHRNMYKSEESGLGQRTFLLLCPAPPTCLELDHIVKAITRLVTLAARLVAVSACLLVPVLLGVIRQVQLEQGPTPAALLTVGALLLLFVADSISKRAQRQQAAAQAACVTAATLQQQLQAGDSSHELATLRAASKTATTLNNSSRPSSTTLQGASAPRAQQSAAAANSRPGSTNGIAAATTYAALEPDLAALQAALGVDISSSHASGSKEHAVDMLKQLSEQLGMDVTHDVTSSPAGMAAAVAQLKQSVGI